MNLLPKIIFIAAFSITIINQLTAQQYPITHYTKDRGLPGNQVFDIYQDSKGYMWFATASGLIKYNGKEYKIFGKRDGLGSDWPFSITEDSKGNLWCTYERGVNRIKNNEVKTWALKKSEDYFKVYRDSYKRIWVYSKAFPGDCYYFQNDSLHNFSSEYNFKNQLIANIIEDQKGGVFFITRDGKFFKYFANQISEIKINRLGEAGVRYAFFDTNNNFIICAKKGLGFITSNGLYNKPDIRWIIDGPINFGIQSKKGFYWFASQEDGLIRLNNFDQTGQDIIHITDYNGLLSNNINLLFEDYEGNIWIGSNAKGISKLSNLMFKKYGSDSREGFDAVLSLTSVDERLYCSTENGIFEFNKQSVFEGKSNYFKRVDPFGKNTSRGYFCMLPLSTQEILLGAVPGIYKLQNSTIQFLGLNSNLANTMMRDHSGKIWIGTNEGIFILQKNNILSKQDLGVADKSIIKLLEVNDKDLYIGTHKGLFIVENGTSSLKEEKNIYTPESNGLPLDYIYDITVDTDGYILVGAVNRLYIINEKKEVGIIDELKDVIVLHLDSNNRLWAGTNSGLYVLQKRYGSYSITNHYSQREGLASDEFTRNNTIYEDNDDKIYFGSYNGLTVYDPSEDFLITAKPKSYISRLEINDSLFSFSKASNIELSPYQNKVSFYCEALSFFNEDAVKFEYYLAPIEKEWQNISSSPKINFAYLEANDYTFYVRSVNQSGVKSDPQSISFTILSPFWERTWFIALSVVILIFIGYQVNHQRQRHIRKRNLLLEQLVKEKTDDLIKNKAQLEESKVHIEDQYHQLLEAQKELVEKRELEKAHNEIQLLKNRLERENIYLREKHGIIQEVSSIIGRSAAVQEIRRKVIEIAGTDTIVLLTGETGVGKNLVAEAIHDLSPRKDRALISVNCAAIPESLVESELFGHEKGAFTGAVEKHEGKFEIADGSTIFLDEIGDMPLAVQAKVLSVLQSQKFMRVGGSKQIKTNARIIAATNQNLAVLVEDGKFRRDLFFRINIYTIHIPALKERTEDIEPLTKYFIEQFAKMLNKKIDSVTKSAIKKLECYHYPGNARELENIIHRALIISKGEVISDEDIIVNTGSLSEGRIINRYDADKLITLEELEKEYITHVLEKTKWKISGKGGAAEVLGLHYNTLRFRMEKLGIPFVKEKSDIENT